ncbi:MAG: hypothetical protein JWN05_1153 [Arthrobacter sp.]|nr:hypothetical protein [Arthrobacter sp.]
MAGLPKLLRGKRRALTALLIGTGVGSATAAGATALLMMLLIDPGTHNTATVVAGLTAAAVAVGGLRAVERVLAEKLGQDYIHEIRTGLVKAALRAERGPSAGITIARATNDLASVRNWVSQGISPLIVGIPLVLGATAFVWALSPALAAAVALPLVLLAGVLAFLARAAYSRARTLRRRRGRLAAHLADTLAAATTIKAASGQAREMRRITTLSSTVAEAAVHRARIAGYIRGAAATAAATGVAATAATGVWQGIDTATIIAAMTILGIIAAPVTDMGRAVEYHQNFRAARRILAPALAADPAEPDPAPPAEQRARTEPSSDQGQLKITGIAPRRCCPAEPLDAQAGERIELHADGPDEATAVFETIIGLRLSTTTQVLINGVDLHTTDPTRRRQLVGYAVAGASLERGTIARAVRYRRPDLHPDHGTAALEQVGLTEIIAQLPDGQSTRLTRGGEPLTTSARAKLLLARATLGSPALLLINRLDQDLDDNGRARLDALITDYPGTVITYSTRSDTKLGTTRTWRVTCPTPH